VHIAESVQLTLIHALSVDLPNDRHTLLSQYCLRCLCRRHKQDLSDSYAGVVISSAKNISLLCE
jgi:hypothetical protein